MIDFTKPLQTVHAKHKIDRVVETKTGYQCFGTMIGYDKNPREWQMHVGKDGTYPYNPNYDLENIPVTSRDSDVTAAPMAPQAPKLDVTKPVQFRDGRPVAYVGKLSGGRLVFEYSPVGLITTHPDGNLYSDKTKCASDVINSPPEPIWPIKRWFIQYDFGGVSGTYPTLEAAKKALAKKGRAGTHIIKEVSFDGKA